jgi:hypothetical protein
MKRVWYLLPPRFQITLIIRPVLGFKIRFCFAGSARTIGGDASRAGFPAIGPDAVAYVIASFTGHACVTAGSFFAGTNQFSLKAAQVKDKAETRDDECRASEFHDSVHSESLLSFW